MTDGLAILPISATVRRFEEHAGQRKTWHLGDEMGSRRFVSDQLLLRSPRSCSIPGLLRVIEK